MTPPSQSEVRRVADEVWEYRLRTDPVVQVRRGIPVTELRGFGLAVVEEDARFAAKMLERLNDLGDPGAHDDVLTAGFLRHQLALAVEAPGHFWHGFTISPYQIGSWLTFLGEHVFAPYTFDGAGSVDTYLSLVADLGRLVREVGERVDGQIERGILLARPAVASTRQALEAMAGSAERSLLPTPERLSGADAERVAALVRGEVSTAFADLLARIGDDYEASAPAEVGLTGMEGGYDFYRFAVRQRNAVDLAPERIHEIGLEQVAELTERMAAVRAELGDRGDEATFHEQLRSDASLFASSPDEVAERYRGYMARLEPLLPDYFRVLPRAPYDIARLQPELEGAVTYGYYEPPTPDSPVGLYRYNASQLDQRSLLNAAAIIYHELAPGHHFHIARQSENEALPDVRREAFDLGSFNEGWAEYAAGLAWEMGMYDTPLERYGRLSHERFIAQRLVVDTGMNVLGWSLDQGRRYMRDNTMESEVQIATETVRYSTALPAQALGYRLGHLAIVAARRRAEQKLGASFDIRDFHEAVLGAGALPLALLDEHVDWFVDNATGQA